MSQTAKQRATAFVALLEAVRLCATPRHMGETGLAKRVHVTKRACVDWVARGYVPAERVVAIERATGVPRERLRPDLYDRGL